MKAVPTPYLTVLVPAYQGSKVLPLSLEALRQSDLPRDQWELIVVDDASTDDTYEVAARWADSIVSLPGNPHGPAYARNRGFETAHGEIVVFIDADVVVHTDTLRRFADVFRNEPDVAAVFGSYDDRPTAPGLISQYRNLLHHYYHQQNAGDAETFWAGCGAIRSSVFAEAGMYDEWHFAKPQIEDIELGNRITSLGHRIVLRPEIQAAHLKRWTFKNMLKTDFNDRGVPWMRLLIQQGAAMKSASLNLRVMEKVKTVLVWVAIMFALAAAAFADPRLLVGSVDALLPLVVLNWPMYAFFGRKRGPLFAAAIFPLHLLYYVVSGIAVGAAWALHHTVGAPRPNPSVEAFSEIGAVTWPPVPRRRSGAWKRPPVETEAP